MNNLGGKVSNKMTTNDVIRLLQTLKDKRFSEWEKNWYESYEAFQNNHFIMYSRETRRLINYSPVDQKFFIQIPKLTKQIRSTVNLISSLKLIPYVYPEDGSEEAIKNAIEVNKMLGKLFQTWELLPTLTDALTDAAVYPVSFVEPAYDPERLIVFNKYDAFDVSFYPMHVTDPRQIQVMVKSVAKPLEDIHNNTNYNDNRSKVVADDRYAKSDFKNTMFRDRSGAERVSANGTAIIDEVQIKERQPDGSVKIRVVTMCQEMELRNKLTNRRDFSLSTLRLQPGQLYQRSLVEYLLPLNQAYDLTFSRIQDFFFRMVKGGWLVRAGSGVKRMTDENGELLIYKNQRPEPMELPEPPAFSIDLFAMLGTQMDDFGVSALASSGKVPKGVRAGKMMDILREQDVQNMRVSIDLYSAFLGDLMTKTLWVIADSLNEKYSFSSVDDKSNYETNVLVSEDQRRLFANSDSGCPPYVSRKMKVKVDVTYEDKVDRGAQLDAVMEMVKAGVAQPAALTKAIQMDLPNELLVNKVTSIIETEEYKMLPPELQKMIVQALMQIHSGATLMDHPDWQKLPPEEQERVLGTLMAGGQAPASPATVTPNGGEAGLNNPGPAAGPIGPGPVGPAA